MYRAVIFDLDNTLMDFEACVSQSLCEVRAHHGVYLDNDMAWDEFQIRHGEHSYQHWMNHVNGTGSPDIMDVVVNTFRDALCSRYADQHEQMGKTYWEYFCRISVFEAGAEQLLSQLHGHTKLGLISNGVGAAQRGRLENGGILHVFDSLLVSDEVGIRKPDPAIFELSLHQLGLQREDVLFVGDSMTDDFAGAVNAGIDFCFYNRAQVPVTTSAGQRPHRMIHSLDELLPIIERRAFG